MSGQVPRKTGTEADALPASRILKVGLLLDSFVVPRWMRQVIAGIRDLPCARLELVVLNRRPAPAARAGFLYRLYRRLDDRLFREEPDAFAPVDVRDLLEGCPVVEVEPVPQGAGDTLGAKDLARIGGHDLDVAVRLGFRTPTGGFARIARHGVWSHHHIDRADAPDGVEDVLAGHPTTAVVLEAVDETGAHVLCRSEGHTDRRSVRRSLNESCWKAARLGPRLLRELSERGSLARSPAPVGPPYRPPGNCRMAWLWLGLLVHFLRDKVRDLATVEQWYLAYRFEEAARAPTDFGGLRRILPPPDRYWADPFPFEHEGRFYIFFEEFPFATQKGTIAVVEVDPERGPGEPRPVLERDHHLSYPFVFAWRDGIYMIPETSEARRVTLFRCLSFPDRWEEAAVLLDGLDAVDATLHRQGDRWWMFVNLAEKCARNCDELHLFHATSPLGPWTPHHSNPVRSDCRAARPAGRVFSFGGELYRPAQNCALEYGGSIALHRILRLDPEEYREEHVHEIHPDWDREASRIHTMNRYGPLFVVDLLRRKPRWHR